MPQRSRSVSSGPDDRPTSALVQNQQDRSERAALLDIDQTATILNTTPRFVRRLVQERRIPYLKVGRFIRFDPVELEAWIDRCRYPLGPER